MGYLHWIFIVFNLTLAPAIFSSIFSIILEGRIRKKLSDAGLSSPQYPVGLTVLEKFVWGFKGFYILWYSMIRKKRYVFKLHIEDYVEVTPLREFCNQHFHGLFAVQFGVIDTKDREEYAMNIIQNMSQALNPGSKGAHLITAITDDPPPLYIDVKFLFERDALWFALHHGDKIV